MPKIYVAFRTDDESDLRRIASGSFTTIKNRIKEVGESEWTLATYVIKADVPTICQIVEDISEVEADEAKTFKVTAAGQVRQVD